MYRAVEGLSSREGEEDNRSGVVGRSARTEAELIVVLIMDADRLCGGTRMRCVVNDIETADNYNTAVRRGGFVVGFSAIAVGLILGLTGHVRESGLAVQPALARNPLHLMAQIQVFAGCAALLVTTLWATLRNGHSGRARLRPLIVALIGLCGLSVLLRVIGNWAIVTGRVTDHAAVLPALIDVVVGVLFVLAAYPLSARTDVGLSSRLMIRSSSWWLGGSAGFELLCTGGRSVANHPSFMWFFERAYIEAALLGFVMMGGMGVMLATLPAMSLNRDLNQVLLRSHQPLNALIIGWGLLQAWSLRYPGSYQSLVLVVVGVGIAGLMFLIAFKSGVMSRWQKALALPAEDNRRAEVVLVTGAILYMLLAGVLFVVTAFVEVATRTAPEEALAGAVLALAVGMVVAVVVAGARRDCKRASSLIMAAVGAVVMGVIIASLLWTLNLVVDRSLDGTIGCAEGLAVLGVLALAGLSARTDDRG